jgi:hypothetical protein
MRQIAAAGRIAAAATAEATTAAVAIAVVAAMGAEEGTNPCVTFDRDDGGVSIYLNRAIFRRVLDFA